MNENKLFEKVLEEANLRQLKENTARIGLFWFSQDYTKIIKIEGEQEISDTDLLKPERMDPIGLHAEYDMPRDIPRGRISYENNIFRIWVGEDCLMEDENIIKRIKKYFGLKNIDSGNFRVKRHYHWNTKI
jgi:hypothetical protein